MEIEASCKRVADCLKCYVNSLCTEGFRWYPDADKRVECSVFDLNYAIEILTKQPNQSITILEDGDE